MNLQDRDFLKLAIVQAKESVKQGGFPAGAIVVKEGNVISKGISIGFQINDPTSHAETASIKDACKTLGTPNLNGATLYESLASCVMCFSVANWAGISRIVSGTRKTEEMISKGYYEGNTDIKKLNQENNRQIELVDILDFEEESLKLIKEWEKNIS